MLKFILQILSRTPWWVYIIFGYLLYVGIKSFKTQIIPFSRFFILAFIFFVLSITKLRPFLEIDDRVPYLWLSSLTIGLFLGILLAYSERVEN